MTKENSPAKGTTSGRVNPHRGIAPTIVALLLSGALLAAAGCGKSTARPAAVEPPVLTRPIALNDAAQVVGGIHDPATHLPAFLLDTRLSDTHLSDTRIDGQADTQAGRQDAAFANGVSRGMRVLAVPAGAAWALPRGLNVRADIAGFAARADDGTRHAVVWQGRACRWLNDQNAQSSEACAINARGEVVGCALEANGARHTLRWNINRPQDAPQDIASLSRLDVVPAAINDRGDVVGWGHDAQNHPRLFLYRNGNGSGQDLGAGYQIALNAQGQMAGAFLTPQNLVRAGAWDTDKSGASRAGVPVRRELATPPGTRQSAALGLNDRGQIVGRIQEQPGSPPRAVLWERGRVVDLNSLLPLTASYTLEEAVGVNNRGQILCAARENRDFRGECALLTPTNGRYTVRIF